MMDDVRRLRMFQVLVQSENNYSKAVRLYRQAHSDFPPSRQSFQRLAKTYAHHGTLKAPRLPRASPVSGPRREEILAHMRENPTQSMRALARHLGMSRETVRKIVKQDTK